MVKVIMNVTFLWLTVCIGWQISLVVTRRSWSTCLLYAGPGLCLDGKNLSGE